LPRLVLAVSPVPAVWWPRPVLTVELGPERVPWRRARTEFRPELPAGRIRVMGRPVRGRGLVRKVLGLLAQGRPSELDIAGPTVN
jgi:hypothetical protein